MNPSTAANFDWSLFLWIVGIAASAPTALIGYLHIRLNSIEKHRLEKEETRARDEKITNEQMHARISELRKESERHQADMYTHIDRNFVTKAEYAADRKSLEGSINGLTNRVGDFITLMVDERKRTDRLAENQAGLAANVKQLQSPK